MYKGKGTKEKNLIKNKGKGPNKKSIPKGGNMRNAKYIPLRPHEKKTAIHPLPIDNWCNYIMSKCANERF